MMFKIRRLIWQKGKTARERVRKLIDIKTGLTWQQAKEERNRLRKRGAGFDIAPDMKSSQ
jgi:hypothetical protein